MKRFFGNSPPPWRLLVELRNVGFKLGCTLVVRVLWGAGDERRVGSVQGRCDGQLWGDADGRGGGRQVGNWHSSLGLFHSRLPWERGTRLLHGSTEHAGDKRHLFSGVAQVPGNGSLQLRPSLVESSKTSLQREVVGNDDAHLVEVFLLLEPAEVVLDQEGGIELPHCDLLFQH